MEEFKWKEVDLIRKQLIETKDDVKKKLKEDNSNMQEIVEDCSVINHWIKQLSVMEEVIRIISEKYGWDK